MGAFFSIHGSVKVRHDRRVKNIITRFCKEVGSDFEVTIMKNEDTTSTIAVSGGTYASYGTAEEASGILEELGPYTVEADYFTLRVDDEDENIFIGTPEAIHKLQRTMVIDDARIAIKELTLDEWDALLKEASDLRFWLKGEDDAIVRD